MCQQQESWRLPTRMEVTTSLKCWHFRTHLSFPCTPNTKWKWNLLLACGIVVTLQSKDAGWQSFNIEGFLHQVGALMALEGFRNKAPETRLAVTHGYCLPWQSLTDTWSKQSGPASDPATGPGIACGESCYCLIRQHLLTKQGNDLSNSARHSWARRRAVLSQGTATPHIFQGKQRQQCSFCIVIPIMRATPNS